MKTANVMSLTLQRLEFMHLDLFEYLLSIWTLQNVRFDDLTATLIVQLTTCLNTNTNKILK